MTALPLFDWQAARDAALKQVAANAGPTFMAQALRFTVQHLRENGECSGEDITDAAKAAGIVPHSDKAFGAVYATLARDGIIQRAGFCLRKKGNGTAGASVWKLKA